MKRNIILFLVICLCISLVHAQDCTQDENVKRFMTRGKVALKTAEKPEDYKLATDEFLKALEYSPKCPDIHYNLGLCYEKMGALDPGNYQEAISYLNNYLAFNPNAANKDEVQEKIYEIEFLAEKAGGVSLNYLVGNWKMYYADGTRNKELGHNLFDIRIYKNNNKFFAQYISRKSNFCFERENDDNYYYYGENKEKIHDDHSSVEIVYDHGTISFEKNVFVHYVKFTCCRAGKEILECHSFINQYRYNYNLKINRNKSLEGELILNYFFNKESYLQGKDTWETVWSKECDENCQGWKIYFVKQ